MLNKKSSYTFFFTQLLCSVILCVLLVLGISKMAVVKTAVNEDQKTFIELCSLQAKTFIGVSHESSALPEELIFEERTDDDDKLDENNFENSHTDLHVFKRTKLPLTLSSKENAYFVCHSENKITIELYNLYCSWKCFLA